MPTENLIVFVTTALLCTTVSGTNAQAGTLGFYLNGVAYPNGSTVLRTDIGEYANALQCTTDSTTCCRNYNGEIRAGEFHFPVSDDTVPKWGGATDGYYRDRDSQLIRLNRQSTGTITGRFRCNIPQVSGPPDANLYINIADILVSITSSGTGTPGESYSLECTVIVTGSTDQPTITWLDPMNNTVSSGVVTTGSMSTLTFNRLAASHAGTYTYRATLDGAVQTEKVTVTVQIPAPTSVTVTPLVVPIVESSITLTCTVELSPLVDVPVTVTTEWSGPDGFMTTNTAQPVIGSPTATYTSTAIVNSPGIEQSGNYTCKATVKATMSSSLINSVGYSSSSVIVVPEPIIDAHSDSSNRVFYDHSPTLICTVEMSSVVTVPLSMMIVWRGPDGTVVSSPIRPEMKSFTLYTSSSHLTFVDLADSGEYTCTVRFENGVEISASTNITIVSLIVQGAVVPNNSLVDVDDILYTTSDSQNPTNDRPGQHDQSLLCVTDLVDCCKTPMLGNWYFPNGSQVTNTGDPSYRSNRGQNEVRNGRQFYGSVRLFRRHVPLAQNEGPFLCVLPDSSNVMRTLSAYIVNFAHTHRDVHVTFSHSGSGTAGETYSLTCEAILINPGILPTGAPTPTFQWSFGPNGNASLPSGLTTPTTMATSRVTVFTNNPERITYTSILQFSPLSQSHAGNYTCRIGAGRLVNSTVVTTVNAPTISAQINTSGTPAVVQNGYSLTCGVNGAQNLNPSITYQWTKNNGTQTQVGADRVLFFSPLRLSDAGRYTCQATVSSPYLNSDITDTASQNVTIQIPAPTSVTVTPPVVPIVDSSITLTCTVEFSPLVDVPVTVTTEWSGPDGFMTTNTAQPVIGSPTATYASTATVSSSDSEIGQLTGNYTCKVTVMAMMSSFLIDTCSMGYSSSRVIVVPEPIMSAHSDSPNRVFYDHSPTLTCTVEMSSVVIVPLSMTVVWRGPGGTVVTSPIRPEMKSFTLYTSSSILTSVDSADSGEYTCTVRFDNGVEISTSTNVTIVNGVFQLRLKSVGICQQYSDSLDKQKQYSNFIKGALITAIKHHCKCHFSSINLNKFKDVFICEDSPNVMIYRSTLIGTLNFNGTQIIGFIQDWVNAGPLIEINGRSVRVDSSCPTAISSLDEPVCGEKEEKCLYDNDPKYAMYAQHLTNSNIANCFEGCVVRNG